MRRNIMSKALVLLSGGMDSTTCAAIAKRENDEVHALNMYYGQKHDVEMESARKIAKVLELDSYTEFDLSSTFANFNSSLLQHGEDIKDDQDKGSVGATYVPARNSIFLSIAAGVADSINADYIYYGAHAEDHGGYPDTTAVYFIYMFAALKHGTAGNVEIRAPFLKKHKSDVVKEAMRIGAPLELTHSCYRGTVPSCGTCPTCQLRLAAFEEAGYEDPIKYKK